MKQMNLKTTIMLLAALAATSCSNETDPTLNPNANPDAVELGITAGVELTKSVIDGGTNAQSGTDANILQEVAVRATGDDYTSDKSNDNAIYTQSGGSWTNSGSDKIYLTAKVATIYAFHPVYTYDANGNKTSTPVTVDGTVGSDATIPVTLFTGGEAESGSPTLKANSTITDADNSNGGKILSAPGEVDYLWEGSDTKPTASNGKAAGAATNKSVNLNMKHALSMVSFKIYKEDNYKGAGLLTKIVLKNASGAALKATGATMNIETGAVTVTGDAAATFTRLIKASASADGAALASTEATAHSYSILVFPDAEGVAKNTIQAVFTIDDADYMKELAANDTPVEWKAGDNNTYTVKLSGTGLTIGTVKVEAWNPASGGNLDIN